MERTDKYTEPAIEIIEIQAELGFASSMDDGGELE